MKIRSFKSLAAALLTMAAVLAGQQAMATATMQVTFKGRAYTYGSTLRSNLDVESYWGNKQLTQIGDGRQFSDYRINWNPVYVTLNGTLRFKEAYYATDVVVNEGTFTVAFENQSLWFYGASVETLNGTAVTNSSVAVSSDRHTITVSISGAGTEFGRINLDFVGTEPFSSNNTVVGGIETGYIYTGNPIEPVPTVTYNGTTLTAGTDYTVSYSNNIMPGTATVTVEGTGPYAGTVTRDYAIRPVELSDFTNLGGNTYAIATTTDLVRLAGYVNLGNNCQGLTFIQTADIAFPHTTDWNDANSTENNYIAIGSRATPFQGTFDGQNHTISGIRIYKDGTDSSNDYQGIFGRVTGGGAVKRVNLADARITGHCDVGGIVGSAFTATIEDCTAGADVCIHAVKDDSDRHGGIVGNNQGAVRRCISRATLTVKNGLDDCVIYGGIVGNHAFSSNSIVTDCIAVGAVIPNVAERGAIIGLNQVGTLTRNFYRDCKVASNVVTPSGVGLGIDWSTTDADGAQPLYALTLPANTGIVRTASATLPGIGNASYTNGADIAGTAYYTGGATLTLTPEQGFTLKDVTVNGTAATNNGDGTWSFTMPAADATVTALMGVPYIDENGNEQNCTDFTVVSSSYAFGDYYGTATLGVDDNVERWYAVVGTVSLDKPLKVNGNARLILCDGAALNINADIKFGTAFGGSNHGLTIYGQARQTGTLSVTNTGGAIGVNTFTVNGGTVIATGGTDREGILISGSTYGILTINRGSVTATGAFGVNLKDQGTLTQNGGTLSATGSGIYNAGISNVNATVNILGGTLSATGTDGAYGIYADASDIYATTVTLGWTNPDDRITASSIYLDGDATLQVRDGQTLYADDVPYSGDITASAGDLAGKTLAPYQGAGSGTSAVTARKASFAGVERYWTTFYSATRYALPAGAQAFIMKSDHVLYRIGDGSVIPAGCAVVIMADASALTNRTATGGIVTLTPTSAAEPSVSGNILLGVDSPTAAPSGAYVMSKVGSDFGFFTFTGTIPANKAYYVE